MVSPNKTIHLALRTAKRQQMVDFFKLIFNFELLEVFALDGGEEVICFMSDDNSAKLELICNPRFIERPSGQVLSHYGFFVNDYAQVLAASISAGLPILDQVCNENRRQFYITDPDGNYVEVNSI